jgi:hypothetical protein
MAKQSTRSLDAPTRVVAFVSHEASRETVAAFLHLQRTCGSGYSLRWLLDTAHGATAPAEVASHVWSFDSRDFGTWGLPTFGPTLLPGHCHYPYLRFFREQPHVEQLWVVEYDVRFTGRWRRLLEHYADDDADLLTCHLRNRPQEPGWFWWPTLRAPIERLSIAERDQWRALLVVARYSARALRTLIESHEAGWSGHQEVVIPTVLARRGLTVRDLDGRTVNGAARPNPHFYTSYSDEDGSMVEGGSVRFKPARARPGLLPNRLYHPVKPAALVARRGLRATWEAKREFLLRQREYRRSRLDGTRPGAAPGGIEPATDP